MCSDSTAIAGIAIPPAQAKNQSTSPSRPDSQRTDSKSTAAVATSTIVGGASSRYWRANTSGSSGASPRTRTIAIDTTM